MIRDTLHAPGRGSGDGAPRGALDPPAGTGLTTRQFLWRLAHLRGWLYLAIGILWLAFYVVPLASGLFVRGFFDALTGRAPATADGLGSWIENAGTGVLLVALVGAAIGREIIRTVVFTAEVFTTHAVRALLGRNLLTGIFSRPGGQALPASPGEAISRFRDDVGETATFMIWLLVFPARIAFAAAAIAVMVRINPWITLAALLPMVAIAAAFRLLLPRLATYEREVREAGGRVAGFIGEIFGAVQAVVVAGAESRTVDRFQTLNEERRRAAIRQRLFSHGLSSITANATRFSTAAIVLLAGQTMRDGRFTVGDLALFLYYLDWLNDFTNRLGFLFERYRRLGVVLERLLTLLQGRSPASATATSAAPDGPVGAELPPAGTRPDSTADLAAARASIPPAALVKPALVYLGGPLPEVPHVPKTAAHRLDTLEATGLTYLHRAASGGAANGGRGIHDVYVRLERGSFTVVTGRIGAGKTTLLRVLLGLLPSDAGEISWNGEPVAQPGAFLVPPRCAYTPQVPRLFSESLRDNVLLGLPETAVDLPTALHRAVLEPDLAAMDNGFDTMIGPRGMRLSGGQVQRTAAARMFVTAPELLVVDDLSSALDVDTERALWERLAARTDVTILAVSHRRPALRRAGHILVLRDGRVDTEGSLEHLLRTSAEMQRLWAGELADTPTEDRP